MQIPVLNGIYTDNGPDFRTSYPVNLIPVPKENGISKGYLRPAYGLVQFAAGPGADRGGINWNGTMYRVMGSKLISVSSGGLVVEIGDVGSGGRVRFDYSFDRLAIASDGNLFYWDGVTLSQVTDADLGTVVDFVWVDGYFMTTDGQYLVVTELNDPFSVNPLKYGSAEADPDPISAVLKIRNEVSAVNRYTIETFDNVGGDLFPFQRIEGAHIQKGAAGTNACCVFLDAIAFLGGGRNEAPSIYIGINGSATKIATREIDQILGEYTEYQLSLSVLEKMVDKAHQHLFVHLPDKTLVYDAAASQAVGEPVWFVLTSSVSGFSKYRAQNMVYCYGKWISGDPLSSNLGYFDDSISSHYGAVVRWEFGTTIAYNEGRGAIFHEIELSGLTGRVALNENPLIVTSYSTDGETWSQDKAISAGAIGDRAKRLVWFQQGSMRNWRVQRFQGDSRAHLSISRIEARIEPLAY